MPRTIGDVSPAVAAALIRRGESNQGTRVTRGPTIRREETGGGTTDLERERLVLAAERAKKEEERNLRQEARSDKAFEFTRDEAGKSRIEREAAAKLAERKLDLGDQAQIAKSRQLASQIAGKIADVLRSSRTPNRDTGRPDPITVQEGQNAAMILWRQLQDLPLPEDEKQAILQQLQGGLPTQAADRAPGNKAIQRGSPQGGGGLGSISGGVDGAMTGGVDMATRRLDSSALASIPSRTP